MSRTYTTLPTNIRPIIYNISLEPNFDTFSFDGNESVEIEVVAPTESITLNSVDLEVLSCKLKLDNGEEIVPIDTKTDKDNETITFIFDKNIPVGLAYLGLKFSGELNDKLRGFYRSKYTNENGDERYLATTQFEATDARRAIPCWDEPQLKAIFKVSLIIPNHMVAVSNMSTISESFISEEKKLVEFLETPPMSTYLLVFVIGELRSVERITPSGTLIRVWATSQQEHQGQFALEVSTKLLEYFNDYFGIPYPLDKLDHLAIPDFAAGAMENWGAITYRETALLVDPENSSAFTRQTVASIIAHEMAHMWFGDLVTMAWWSDLWLNESFASWMGDTAVNHIFPEWDVWAQFVSEDTNRALSLDGLKNSHPIEQEVKNPAEIGQLFDAISYSKGGSVLRMLANFLGAENFREGLHHYLSTHQYGNARTKDLWASLTFTSGQPVSLMMENWVEQPGYPVLHVSMNRTDKEVAITAKQSRFTYDHLINPEITQETVWKIPFNAKSANEQKIFSTLIEAPEGTLKLDPTKDWVKINSEQTGFYRVAYTPEDWKSLRVSIEKRQITSLDRLGLQNDAYALTRAGYLPITEFLDLAKSYKNETDAIVWSDLASNLASLSGLLENQPAYQRFQIFGQQLFNNIGHKVGWDAKPEEGHLDALLRNTVLGALGNYGDKKTLLEAQARFKQYVNDPNKLHPDIRTVVLCLAAKLGDRYTYDILWELENNAAMEEDKVRLLAALTKFESPHLLEETLNYSLNHEKVRTHNTIRVISGVASNPIGSEMAWEFVKENWAEFDRRYGEGGFGLMALVNITSRFSTEEKLEDVRSFFALHPTPAADRSVQQCLEKIRLNRAWLAKNGDKLENWLGS